MNAEEYQEAQKRFFPVQSEERVERALLIVRAMIRAGRVDPRETNGQRRRLAAAREAPWLVEAEFSRLDPGDPLRLQLEKAGVELLPSEVMSAQTQELTHGRASAFTPAPLVQASAKADLVLVHGRDAGIVGNIFER